MGSTLRFLSEEICVEDCINRLTQVECLPGDCKGGAFCMNQRCVWRHSDTVLWESLC